MALVMSLGIRLLTDRAERMHSRPVLLLAFVLWLFVMVGLLVFSRKYHDPSLVSTREEAKRAFLAHDETSRRRASTLYNTCVSAFLIGIFSSFLLFINPAHSWLEKLHGSEMPGMRFVFVPSGYMLVMPYIFTICMVMILGERMVLKRSDPKTVEAYKSLGTWHHGQRAGVTPRWVRYFLPCFGVGCLMFLIVYLHSCTQIKADGMTVVSAFAFHPKHYRWTDVRTVQYVSRRDHQRIILVPRVRFGDGTTWPTGEYEPDGPRAKDFRAALNYVSERAGVQIKNGASVRWKR